VSSPEFTEFGALGLGSARKKAGESEGATGSAMEASVRAREARKVARHGEAAWRCPGEQLLMREGGGEKERGPEAVLTTTWRSDGGCSSKGSSDAA
jgi:hypothetical protein